ncbi:MAG: hypothetical protein KJ935_05065 [Candidatus Omnitrophica bacterium]|nr:hypothetical protein [Candidatus Omnitrophota bacterium]
MRKNAVSILALGVFLFRPVFANAAENRIPFHGLKTVAVFVENIDQEAVKDGLSKEQIKIDVELRLREAGIQVVPVEKSLSLSTPSYLYVIVNTVKFSSGLEYVYGTSVQLKQVVVLKRKKPAKLPIAYLWATTWEKSEGVEITWVEDLVGNVREHINEKVDAFISDYLAENPK